MNAIKARDQKKAQDQRKAEAAALKTKAAKDKANLRQKRFRKARREKLGEETFLAEQRAQRNKSAENCVLNLCSKCVGLQYISIRKNAISRPR